MDCAITYSIDQYQALESKREREAEVFEKRCKQLEEEILEAGAVGLGEHGLQEMLVDDADFFAMTVALIAGARSDGALRTYQELLQKQIKHKLPEYARLCAEYEQEKKTGPVWGEE